MNLFIFILITSSTIENINLISEIHLKLQCNFYKHADFCKCVIAYVITKVRTT